MNNFLGHKGVPLPQMKSTLRPLEILPECLVDDLGNGQAVQVCLAPDRLDPAPLDMEGDPLGLLGDSAGLFQDGLDSKGYVVRIAKGKRCHERDGERGRQSGR